MKKVLLVALAVLGLNLATFAQVKTDSTVKNIAIVKEVATIETLSEKMDQFITSQTELNERFEKRITNTNQRLQNWYDNSSWRWFFRDMVPLVVMLMIGVFFIGVIYMLTSSRYRNNKLRYETMLKATEMTGSFPDFFRKVEIQRSEMAPISGRTHLILSIISGCIAIIFFLCAAAANNKVAVVFAIAAIAMIVIAVLLFLQYNNRIISENNRTNQQ